MPNPTMTYEEESERILHPADMDNQDEAIAQARPARDQGRIGKLRQIVREKSAMRVEGTLVDLFSASMAVQVWDAINDSNREKLSKMPVAKMIICMYKAVNRNQSRTP